MKRTFINLSLLSSIVAITTSMIAANSVLAQSQNVITGEGIGNEIDKNRRGPTVSVSTHVEEGAVKILVDAYIAAPEYKNYPIEFNFYINREFYTSQIRSTELPGPVGITVPNERASLPFNYTIVATTLHPNREFTSIINGAVFASDLGATFDCTLTTGGDTEDSIEYIANDVVITQTGNETATLEFDTHSTPEGHSVVLSGSIAVNGEASTGSVTFTEDEGTEKTVELSGEVVSENNQLSTLDLSSADGSVILSCS